MKSLNSQLLVGSFLLTAWFPANTALAQPSYSSHATIEIVYPRPTPDPSKIVYWNESTPGFSRAAYRGTPLVSEYATYGYPISVFADGRTGLGWASTSGAQTISDIPGDAAYAVQAQSGASAALSDTFAIDGPGLTGRRGVITVAALWTTNVYLPDASDVTPTGQAYLNSTELPDDSSAVEVTITFGEQNVVHLSSETGRWSQTLGGSYPGAPQDYFADNSWGAYCAVSWGGISAVRLEEDQMNAFSVLSEASLNLSDLTLTSASGFDYRDAAGPVEVFVVPEPGTIGLLALGALAQRRRRPRLGHRSAAGRLAFA